MIGEQDVIATTADIWTSSSNMNAFLSLTAQFIDKNFKRKILVLATRHFPETHSSENIAQVFRYILQSWGMETQQISMCITDNAANMKKAFLSAGVENGSCAIHTLQLFINDGLFVQRYFNDILQKLRKIVGHFSHSASASSKLKEIQVQLGIPQKKLIQDVSTRWNSTFYICLKVFSNRKLH